MREAERGQATVEWVGLLPSSRCCSSRWSRSGCGCRGRRWRGRSPRGSSARRRSADRCGDEPALIAAYGTEVGRAGPAAHADARSSRRARRRCRSTSGAAASTGCGDGAEQGHVRRTDAGLPVTAFVHVVDCRADAAGTRSGRRRLLGIAGRQPLPPVLALLRRLGDPARGPDRRREGLPPRRLGGGRRSASAPTARSTSGPPRTTATTTRRPDVNWASDAGIGPLKDARPKRSAPAPDNGWGPETHLLLVSGGSHAGNAAGDRGIAASPRAAASTWSRSSRSPPATRRPLRDHPALAQAGLARPRGRGHRLTRRAHMSPY